MVVTTSQHQTPRDQPLIQGFPQAGWNQAPRRQGFRFKTLLIVLVVGILAGGIGGFLLGQQNPTDAAVRDRIAEKMAEAFAGTPFGGTFAPGAESGQGAPETVEPTPVTIGQPTKVNFGGTEDALTFTVTKVTRQSNCPGARGGMLVLQVDIATGPIFNQSDMPFSTFGYTDQAGVTHPGVSTKGGGEKGFSSDAPASCSDGLPYGHEMKPNARYTGSVLLDLPADAKVLTFGATGIGTDQEWSLPIPPR